MARKRVHHRPSHSLLHERTPPERQWLVAVPPVKQTSQSTSQAVVVCEINFLCEEKRNGRLLLAATSRKGRIHLPLSLYFIKISAIFLRWATHIKPLLKAEKPGGVATLEAGGGSDRPLTHHGTFQGRIPTRMGWGPLHHQTGLSGVRFSPALKGS